MAKIHMVITADEQKAIKALRRLDAEQKKVVNGLSKMGRAGRCKVETEYGIEGLNRQLLASYQRVLSD